MKWFHKVQGMVQEDIALITQNFLSWAGTAPPIFALNMQILSGPNWTWKGENPSPCPQWSCRRHWDAGLCAGQQWGLLCLGLLLHSPEFWDLGSWSALCGKLLLCAAFWVLFSRSHRAGRAEPHGCWAWFFAVPKLQLWSCVAKQEPAVPYCSCWWTN